MLSQFKSFDLPRLQLEDLIALEAFGHGLRESYERNQIDEPPYVNTQLVALKREIRNRNADRLASRKAEIQRSLAALKTPAEKKAELRKLLADIEKQEQK